MKSGPSDFLEGPVDRSDHVDAEPESYPLDIRNATATQLAANRLPTWLR